MSESEPEFWQTVPTSNTFGDQKTLFDRFQQNPIPAAASVGAIFSAILPVIVVIWKIDLCNYGLGDDIGGVFICIPPFMVLGAAVGTALGHIGRIFSRSLQHRTSVTHHELIGTVTACVLAAVAGVVIGIVPAAMLAFPDC